MITYITFYNNNKNNNRKQVIQSVSDLVLKKQKENQIQNVFIQSVLPLGCYCCLVVVVVVAFCFCYLYYCFWLL